MVQTDSGCVVSSYMMLEHSPNVEIGNKVTIHDN